MSHEIIYLLLLFSWQRKEKPPTSENFIYILSTSYEKKRNKREKKQLQEYWRDKISKIQEKFCVFFFIISCVLYLVNDVVYTFRVTFTTRKHLLSYFFKLCVHYKYILYYGTSQATGQSACNPFTDRGSQVLLFRCWSMTQR